MRTPLLPKATLLISLLCFAFCFSSAQRIQYYKGSVPDSLLDQNFVLLVMKAEKGIMQNSFNRKLSNALAYKYPGQFELVGKKDLESAPYTDASKYRYIVNYNATPSLNMTYTANSNNIQYGELVFYDRLLKKDLPRTGHVRGSYITLLRDLGKYISEQGK